MFGKSWPNILKYLGNYKQTYFIFGMQIRFKYIFFVYVFTEKHSISFSDDDIQFLMNNSKPAEKFLFELGARLCTIEIFCDALEKCQLFNILMLFKKYCK